ncbi:MAG: methyl-accepting chemotaxis protein, partial [Bacillota bacterium]|nr:methyl-accepting chemotaxis protein [Bacillota bacterium]
VEPEWGTLISSYYPLKDSSGTVVAFVGVDYDATSAYAGLKNIQRLSVIIPLLAVIIAGIILTLLMNYITKPILRVAGLSQRVAANDLAVEKLEVISKDEIGLLTSSFNKMVENIRAMSMSIKSTAQGLAGSSQSIAATIEELSASSEEMSRSIQEIADGADRQLQEGERAYEANKGLDEKLEEISTKLDISLENANSMKEKNILGTKAVEELGDSFNKYMDSAQEVSAKVEKLSERSRSIESILESINSIAEQTNLLALNAAIEAARAGEQGRGFAVVAEEVRKLAEESSSSTKEIRKIIDDIVREVSEVEHVLSTSSSLIDGVKNSVEVSESSFINISSSVEVTINQLQMLNRDMKEIGAARDKVIGAIENISETLHQSVSATEEISASAQEQSASTVEISASIQGLDDMVQSLNELVSKYKL